MLRRQGGLRSLRAGRARFRLPYHHCCPPPHHHTMTREVHWLHWLDLRQPVLLTKRAVHISGSSQRSLVDRLLSVGHLLPPSYGSSYMVPHRTTHIISRRAVGCLSPFTSGSACNLFSSTGSPNPSVQVPPCICTGLPGCTTVVWTRVLSLSNSFDHPPVPIRETQFLVSC